MLRKGGYEDWRKLHNEELHDLYFSPHIIRVIRGRRIRWAEHVACGGGGEEKGIQGFHQEI
jgi:hypothetical protein